MQTWWNSSPYYDTSVYLPGSPNRKTDSALTQAWIQGAEQQGWGLIPIWFGLQSSCVITKAGISQFFGPTVAAASTQGAQQADLAIAAAATLGLTTGVIYTDIENYTVNGTCSPLVQAYVDGWDSELHLNGYLAGVYANPGPITSDISQVSTIPDEIWVTKTSANTKPQATIWNQGISDALWPKDQRIHQFLIDQPSVSFGGYTLPQGIKIDDDVDDAPVISATGTKPVGLAYTTVDCPGATNTYPVGINSINNNNGAYINGSGQVGTIVGQYYDSNNAPHAYESSGSTCVNIDYPGALVTWAYGINNVGQVVGYYEDSIGKFHGFLKTGTKFTTINYPGYANTYLDDINDAGQIIGVAYQSNLGSQEFLYYGGQFFQGYTNAEINGFATSVASSSPYSYEISLIPPSWSGNEAPINPGGNYAVFADGINNSGDISGGIAGSVCPGPCGFLLPDNNSNFFIFEYPNSTTTNPTRINDLSQVVGSYIDPTSGYAHGFLVTVR